LRLTEHLKQPNILQTNYQYHNHTFSSSHQKFKIEICGAKVIKKIKREKKFLTHKLKLVINGQWSVIGDEIQVFFPCVEQRLQFRTQGVKRRDILYAVLNGLCFSP
jgi:hypothetical protein